MALDPKRKAESADGGYVAVAVAVVRFDYFRLLHMEAQLVWGLLLG